MNVLIDIPEWLYDSISEYPSRGFAVSQLERAILHGTVLPEHGRLGDLDALEQYVIDKYSEGEQLAIDISDAPTILEATKGEG